MTEEHTHSEVMAVYAVPPPKKKKKGSICSCASSMCALESSSYAGGRGFATDDPPGRAEGRRRLQRFPLAAVAATVAPDDGVVLFFF